MNKRPTYALLFILTIAAGLASRSDVVELTPFLKQYAGDTLWAMMVYWGCAFLLINRTFFTRSICALGFAWFIEFLQLYHAPWIDAIRKTTFGGLVLGYDFVLSDLLCYTVGVLFALILDLTLRFLTPNHRF